MWCAQCFLHVKYQHVGQYNSFRAFHFSMPCPLAPSMHYRPIDALHGCCSCCSAGAAGCYCCWRWWRWRWWWWVAGRRAVLAQGRAGLAHGSVQPLPAILCFSLKWHHVLWCAQFFLHLTCTIFVGKMMTLTQCAQCFVQIQHVEVRPCLWYAHCVLHACGTWTKTITKQ